MDWIESITEAARPWLGLGQEPGKFTALQVCLRGLLMFTASIVIIRIADKRFLSRKTAFDAVLAFTLASMLSRAINGSARIGPTVACGFALVLAHRLLAHLSWRWHWVGVLIKGREQELIREGVLNQEAMRRHRFSERDLMEDLRLEGVEHPSQVQLAHLERSGELSVIKKKAGDAGSEEMR